MKNTEQFIEMINQIKNNNIESIVSGTTKECYDFLDYVVLKYDSSKDYYYTLSPSKKQLAIARLKKIGFKTPSIVYHTIQKNDHYEIQEKAKGRPLFYGHFDIPIKNKEYIDTMQLYLQIVKENKSMFIDLMSAPTEHFAEFIDNYAIGHMLGILGDCHSSNLFYDKESGFSFIDFDDDLESVYKNYTPKELKNLYKRSDKIDTTVFAKNLFSTFSGLYLSNEEEYTFGNFYKNLLAHKFFDGILNCSIPFSEEQLINLKSNLFCDERRKNTVSDFSQKELLTYIGLLPKETNENNPADNFTFYKISDKKFDNFSKSFYINAINNLIIDGKPAIEYYASIKNPNLENNNDSDNLELENSCDELAD